GVSGSTKRGKPGMKREEELDDNTVEFGDESLSKQPCQCCRKQELDEVIKQKDLKKNWDDCYLTPDMLKTKVRPNIIYTFNGKPKLLLLRNVIGKKVYDETLDILGKVAFKKAKDTNRNSVKQLLGGEQLFGWYKGKPNDPITQATRDQFPLYRGL